MSCKKRKEREYLVFSLTIEDDGSVAKMIKDLMADMKSNNLGAKNLLKAAAGAYAPRSHLKKFIKAWALWSAASWAVRKIKSETFSRAFENKKARSGAPKSS